MSVRNTSAAVKRLLLRVAPILVCHVYRADLVKRIVLPQLCALGCGEEIAPAALDREHAREHGRRRRDDALECPRAAPERQWA